MLLPPLIAAPFIHASGCLCQIECHHFCTRRTSRGWDRFEGPNNRGSLIDQLNNTQFEPFREGLYNYHRKALDDFNKDHKLARATITETLNDIKQLKVLQPISFLLESYFLAKNQELVQIFSEGSREEKTKVFEILRRIDPTNTQSYERIMSTTSRR